MQDPRLLLGANAETSNWVEHLEAIGAPGRQLTLPPPDELPSVLLDLAVPHEDINDLVARRPSPDREPAIWWLLERCAHSMIRTMGRVDGPHRLPALPDALGWWSRTLYVYVFLAMLPWVRGFHRGRGVADEVSRHTLLDLGRHMALHRRDRGETGLATAYWLTLHFRGAIYQLGRLQFERARVGARTAAGIAAAGLLCAPGEPVLAVHIPEFLGPLAPTACDASFRQAKSFFQRHFPEEPCRLAVCHSWLLDQQLSAYLPEGANILRFQRRFAPAYRPADDDGDIQRAVFGRSYASVEDIPRRTTLERAIADHLRAGRHWRGGAGWLLL